MKKYIVVYSSKTGNTKMIAEAILERMPQGTPCVAVENAPESMQKYDCVIAGFWVDKGTADAKAQGFLRSLQEVKVALFATLGANPHSPHAAASMEQAKALVPENNTILDCFICQGKVDPVFIELMKKMFPAGHPHAVDEKREALHREAALHPNEEDCLAAQKFAEKVVARLENES